MTVYPKGSRARDLVEQDNPTGYPRGSEADKIVRAERRLKRKNKKKITTRDSYQPSSKDKVTRPSGRSAQDKLKMYEALTGQSALQPLRDLIDGPSAPNMAVPDLASEVREGVEAKKALIRATPKMYPMYYERANEGTFVNKKKFIKVKTKLGRTKKTKLL